MGRTSRAGSVRAAAKVALRPRTAARRLRSLGRRTLTRRRTRRVATLLDACGPLLPTARTQRVVLLVSAERSRQLDPWLRTHAQHHVLVVGEGAARPRARSRNRVVVRPTSSLAEIHGAIKGFGAVHRIVDLRSADVAEHRETWRTVVFHLRQGGTYLVPRPAPLDEAQLIAWAAELAAYAPKDAPHAATRAATSAVALLPACLAVVKTGHHYVAVLDDEVATLLPAREPGARVELLTELPPGVFESRVTTNSFGAAGTVELPEQLTRPPLRLRHYTAPIVFAGRTLMYTGNSILPDSFRFYRAGRMEHPILPVVQHDFRTIPPGNYPRADLDGDFFVLDAQWTGHFGHIMTEVVPRLWGWDEAKRRFPDLKVLFAVPRGDGDPLTRDPVLRRLLLAYGIPESDLVAVDHAVRVQSVVTATAMWHNLHPHFVHPDVTDVWARIGANLATTPAQEHERIFVSRRPSLRNRACHNGADVERLFESYGFTVVYPEDLDLGEQAGVFRAARVVAGFGGSAMFNLMYTEHLDHLILLSHEAYTARNEHLYSSLLGGRADYFWSAPDIPRVPGRYTPKAFVSSWTFDFARNQEALEKVLGGLGSG